MYARARNPKYICRKCYNKIPIADLESLAKNELKLFFGRLEKDADAPFTKEIVQGNHAGGAERTGPNFLLSQTPRLRSDLDAESPPAETRHPSLPRPDRHDEHQAGDIVAGSLFAFEAWVWPLSLC